MGYGDFYRAGMWGGLGRGAKDLAHLLGEREKMGEQKKESELRRKMLDLQIQKETRAQGEHEAQQQAVQGLSDLLTKGVQEPSIIGGPVEGPITPEGLAPAAPPPFTSRPANQQELYGALARAQPKEFATGLMRRLLPDKAGNESRAFATPQDAINFQMSPEFKTLYPSGARTVMTSRGFQFEGMNPVNVAANVYHSVLAATGNQQQAQQAYNNTLQQMGASTGFGGEMGKANAMLGQPPLAGIGGAVPPPPPQAPPPMQQPKTAQVEPGPRPTPSGGPSAPARAAEIKGHATATGRQKAEAEEQLVGLSGAMTLVDELDLLSKPLATKGIDTLSGISQSAGQYVESFNPGKAAGIYEARKQTVGENLARQIGGVKGTATEGDIYRMLTALPKIWGETEESRAYKIGAFREIINTAIRNKQRYIAGEAIDPARSQAEFKKLVDQFVAGTYKVKPQLPGRLVPVQ
jgi:hypothetical protein